MTGLLHRLAARATGTGWTVRSDVRLPFGAAGLEPAQETVPTLMEAPVPERRAPGQTRSQSTRPAAPTAPPGRAQPARPAQPAAEVPKPLMPTSRQAPGPRTPVTATAPPLPPEFALVAPPAATRTEAPVLPVARPKPQSPPLGQAPEPLLPPRPPAAGRAEQLAQAVPGSAPFALRPAQQAATRRETEVHIHIGRIDVTALHEAPRPKARPRERPQPVSLDAYLAARSKS